jgi:hypothetical protein
MVLRGRWMQVDEQNKCYNAQMQTVKTLIQMKTLLIIPCLLLSFFGNTQTFTLTPAGFKNSKDTTKDFVVMEYKGKNKADLYKQVLLYMNKIYSSPKDVISTVDNESITINGISQNSVRRNSVHVFDLNYTINFEFKDEKIKISAPAMTLSCTSTGTLQHMYVMADNSAMSNQFGIWNNKLKLKSELAKNDLEHYFNNYFEQFSKGIGANNDW